ncbi:MAG: hypothetical protein LBK77_01580 [Spirochaetaceae bacterium]|jgi:hypothetical protein|nr:hypothetical protein [Spirochaetaceae bacterium]
MTVDELEVKLDAVLKEMPPSGFDAVADTVIADLDACAGCAGELGMKSCKQLLENLTAALKTRKTGGNTDESVQLRVTALDFYVKKLQSGSTEDL